LQDAFKNIDLRTLAKSTRFYQRKPQKAKILYLTQSFLHSAVNACWSFRIQAFQLGLIGNFTYARQSLYERINSNTVLYMRELLKKFMQIKMDRLPTGINGLDDFKRVIIQDSTCIKLADHLRSHFQGSSNQTSKSFSILRLQVVYDLLSESFVRFSFSGFNRNDQAAAVDVIDYCEENDLILRDLGYFTLKSLQGIKEKGAFFISRLRNDVSLFDADGKPLNLLKLLRKKKRIDQVVLLGSKKRISVRLVAAPVPASVAEERKRKARLNRDKRCKPSPNKLALLGWGIFITNIPVKSKPAAFITDCYGLRWRIETLFKAYKQNFNLNGLPRGNTDQLMVALYAKLILITIVHKLHAICMRELPSISFMKFSQLIALMGHQFFNLNQKNGLNCNLYKILLDHSSYDSRRRINFNQSLQSLA